LITSLKNQLKKTRIFHKRKLIKQTMQLNNNTGNCFIASGGDKYRSITGHGLHWS